MNSEKRGAALIFVAHAMSACVRFRHRKQCFPQRSKSQNGLVWVFRRGPTNRAGLTAPVLCNGLIVGTKQPMSEFAKGKTDFRPNGNCCTVER
jgi:hypothetical protein